MDPEELEEMTREDVLLAAAIIFFVAFFGLIFNILGITVVMKNPILKNSFGTLCLSHSIANSGVLFVFFIWSAPATYIQAQHTNGMISKLLGQLNILCWDACVYSHLAISFNRFFSIAIPARILLIIHRKHSHFTSNDEAVKRRKVEIRFFMQSCLQGILFFYEIFNFYYVSTLNTNQWYVFFTATFAWEICHCLDGLLLNLSTWILISEETIRRHPIESKLLREELWRTLGFLVAATSSNVLSGWLGERWQKYLLTCVVWQGYHLLDGLIVLVFHFHRKLLADQKNQEPHHTPSFIHVDHPGHHSLPHAPITHHPVHFSRVDTS
ncbi:hypothetical protein B9Z55_016147 [Caenorhabditis nigoni]|nr:hypothetical protein B9Z55_016147 [Caenorhabditis nigoni]